MKGLISFDLIQFRRVSASAENKSKQTNIILISLFVCRLCLSSVSLSPCLCECESND